MVFDLFLKVFRFLLVYEKKNGYFCIKVLELLKLPRLIIKQQNIENGKNSINDFVLDHFKERWEDYKHTVEYLFGLHDKPLVGYDINYTIYEDIVEFANEDRWIFIKSDLFVKFN